MLEAHTYDFAWSKVLTWPIESVRNIIVANILKADLEESGMEVRESAIVYSVPVGCGQSRYQ